MAKATTRTHFHSSRLIRVLADLALLETAAPGAAFAERLGLWVAYTDAITLCAVQNASPAGAVAKPGGAGLPVAKAFAQARADMEAAIGKGGAAVAASDDYEAWRRHYVAQQRDMELKVGPLRALLRDAMEQAGPALCQLAQLDAAFDGILAEREARLLATLPLLLKKRFAHLQRTHLQPQDAAAPDGKPALSLQAGDWLVRFGQELQTVLLAELDLRLQPALGLLEAMENETPQQEPQHA
jgi:hypothetical protein